MLKWFEPWNPIYLCVYFDLSFGFNTTFWTLTVSALAIIKLIKCFQAYNNTIQVSLKNLDDVLAVFVFYDSRGPSDLIYRHPSKVAQTPNVSQFFCVLPHLIFKLFFHLFSDENNWKKCWNSSQRIILWYPFLMKYYILWYTFRLNVLKSTSLSIFKIWERIWFWRHTWISRTLSQAKVDVSQASKWCCATSWNTK